MNRQQVKKRLLELEQQAAELKQRALFSEADITSKEICECYQWMLDNNIFNNSPDTYIDAIDECSAQQPNSFTKEVGGFFANFHSKF